MSHRAGRHDGVESAERCGTCTGHQTLQTSVLAAAYDVKVRRRMLAGACPQPNGHSPFAALRHQLG